MRSNPTEPERLMWMALRSRRFEGHKFRRQAVMGNRIVDFFCPASGLVIEIDGDTHDPKIDRKRDEQLKRQTGFVTLRFTNPEVMESLDGVLIALQGALEGAGDRWAARSATTPQPPPLKRRGNLGDRTLAEAIRAAAARLEASSDTARLDAEMLAAHLIGCSRTDMLLHRMRDPAPEGLDALIGRRLNHEPVAYITGRQEFFGLPLAVSPAVLIPRGDSEVLVEAALALRPEPRRMLDCGTGSGALLLAVLAQLPAATGIGIDRSAEALAVASANAASLGLTGRAEMRLADWAVPGWACNLGQFDLILANPPYVEDAAHLDPSVRDHEPAGALFAGPDGLDAYRALIPQLPGLLAPGGTALVEIGATQAQAVGAIAARSGLGAKVHRDLAGRDRVLELKISLGKASASA